MHADDLHDLLDQYGLGEQFAVDQADGLLLRCRDCGETVRAGAVDLHRCGQATADYGEPDAGVR